LGLAAAPGQDLDQGERLLQLAFTALDRLQLLALARQRRDQVLEAAAMHVSSTSDSAIAAK
jgi:hypothetical protein